MSIVPTSLDGARDRGRGSLAGPRLAGAAAASVLLLGATLAVAALTRAGATGLALLAAIAVAAGTVLLPQRLLAATRASATARAAVDGARGAGQALAPALAAGLAALAAANLVAAVGSEMAPALTTATYLWAAVALLVAGVGAGVVFPGAWLLPSRSQGASRAVWPALLVAGVALAYPGAYEVFVGVTRSLPEAPGLGWDALALVALGGLSAAGAALAAGLLPRAARALAMDAQGQRAVVARRGGACLLDVTTGETVARFVEGTHVVAVAPDGQRAALAGPGDEVAIRRLSDGALVRRLSGAPRGVTALAFDWDGERVAAVGDAAAVALWELTGAANVPERHPTLAPYGRSLAFTRDGATLLIATGAGAVCELPLGKGGPPRGPLRPALAAVSRAVLSPDGRELACATGQAPVFDQAVSLRVRGGQPTAAWTREVGETVRAVAVGAEGAVAVATLDGSVRVFDAVGKLVGSHQDVGDGLSAVAIDAGGGRVVVGGRWAVARWDVGDGAVTRLGGPSAHEGAVAPRTSVRPAR